METRKKDHIDIAFVDSFLRICTLKKVPVCQSTILVRFDAKQQTSFFFCRKDKINSDLEIEDILTPKMIGLGISIASLRILLQCVHFAFTKEKRIENERVTLLIYYSVVAGNVCIGILEDKKPQRTLIVSDIFEAMNIGEERNN